MSQCTFFSLTGRFCGEIKNDDKIYKYQLLKAQYKDQKPKLYLFTRDISL